MLLGSSSNTKMISGAPYLSLDDFFKNHRLTPQLFTVDPTRRTTVVGKKGTRITILPNSLVDLSGNLVKGEVQIQLLEVFSSKEALFSSTFMASEESVLDMGGQLLIQAVQNYFPLQIIRPLPVEMPTQSFLKNPIGMKLYSGGISSTRPFNEQPSFEWKLISPKKLKIGKTGKRKYFSFYLLDFNWVGCAISLNKKRSGSMVSAKYVNALGDLDESMALLHFKGRNAIIKMHHAGQRFTRFNVPLKGAVDLLVFGIRDGLFFAGLKHYERLSSTLLKVELQQITETELLDIFNKFDQQKVKV